MNKKIEGTNPGSNGLFFLPYLLGERSPRWNPEAKGAWIGMSLESGRGDIIRSVLEGVSFNLEIIFSIMSKFVPINEMIVIGGGAKGRTWMKILSEILDTTILIPKYLEEATSMGAAIIGGVGLGCLKNFSEASRFISIVDKIEPDAQNVRIYEKLKPVFDLCYKSLENVFPELR